MDVWDLFSDKSYLGAILDRQGLSVAAPVDLRTKKTESFSPQLLQGFWSKLKKRNPKIVVMYPTATTKNSKQKRGYMATVPSVLNIFLTLEPVSGKIWWLKKGTTP